MKKYITITACCLLIASLLFSGCKTTNNTSSDTAFEPIPSNYPERKDSSNSASMNWRQYFRDSTLSSLIDTALKNNFDLRMAMQRIEASRANIRFANAALIPTINPTFSVAQRKFGLYTMDGAGNITTEITDGQIVPIHLRDFYLGLQSSWEIDIWGKLRNRKKATVARYLASVEGKNLVTSNLVSEVAMTYYDLLALDQELEIILENIQLQDSALSIVRLQKQTGMTNELAVKQFEAQLLQSKILKKEVLQQILETENRMNFLLGRYPQPILRDKSKFDEPLTVQTNTGVPSDLLRNRPDIRQAEFSLAASKADVKAARAAFYPSLNITGTYGFQAFKTGFLFNTPESVAYTILGGLTAPLINRNAIKAEFRSSTALQREALFNYQQSIINGYVEVYNEMSRIRRLQEIQELRSSEVNVLTQSVDASSELFRTGRATYLEVLLTQRNRLDSRLQLVDAKRRQYFATVNIYKALGGGWQ